MPFSGRDFSPDRKPARSVYLSRCLCREPFRRAFRDISTPQRNGYSLAIVEFSRRRKRPTYQDLARKRLPRSRLLARNRFRVCRHLAQSGRTTWSLADDA